MDNRDKFKAFAAQSQRVFQRQFKFESMLVQAVDSYGNATVITGGRESPKTRVGSVLADNIGSGDRLIVLGSTANDMPIGFGKTPWVTG